MKRKAVSIFVMLALSITLYGCGNLFKSMETLDDADKKQQAELDKESGDYSALRNLALDILIGLGEDYDTPTRSATEEGRQARVDAARADLNDYGAAPIEQIANILENLDDEASTASVFEAFRVPTENLEGLKIAATNLAENVDTSNSDETLIAAGAQMSAVVTILDNYNLIEENPSASDEEIAANFNAAVDDGLLGYSSSAIDLYGYTTEGSENDDLDELSGQLDRLDALNNQLDNQLISTADFVTSLNALLQSN